VNAKKERELLVVGLKKLLQKESKIGEEYRALAEMLEGIPAGLLLDWVVMERKPTVHSCATLLVSSNRPLRREAETARTAWRWKEMRCCFGLQGSE